MVLPWKQNHVILEPKLCGTLLITSFPGILFRKWRDFVLFWYKGIFSLPTYGLKWSHKCYLVNEKQAIVVQQSASFSHAPYFMGIPVHVIKLLFNKLFLFSVLFSILLDFFSLHSSSALIFQDSLKFIIVNSCGLDPQPFCFRFKFEICIIKRQHCD